jgi:cell pole-organizing protein PopZ
MHKQLVMEIVASVRRRIEQGDCPIEAPFSREQLEDALDSLAGLAKESTQAIYDLATARLRNPPLDPNVEHDMKEMPKLAELFALGELKTTATSPPDPGVPSPP